MSFPNQSVIPVSAPFLESSNLLLQDAFSDLTTFKPASSLVFIDAGVADFQTLITGVKADRVFLLNATQDGVAQIAQVLSQFQDVAAIHIVSHGQAGRLQLGATDLSLNTLNRYSSALQSWAPHLSKGADVLLYGCDVALGMTGNAFIQNLSHIIGADIAASNNLTGSANLGGDWNLEVKTGEIAANLAFDATTIATYGYTFDTAVSNTQVNTIATGLNTFLTTLQTRLDQVTGSRLPILGTGLTQSTQFFDSTFRTALTTGLTGAATVADIQARVAQAFGGTITSNPLSVTNSGNFVIDLRVRKAIANPIATSLDLGLNVGADAALKFQNALQVTPNVNYEFGLKFGLKDNQFSLDFSDAKEIGINFGLDLKNTLNNTDAKFGLLNVKVADAGTNFNESLAIDIQTEGSDFKLSPILTENSPNGTQIKLSLSSQSSNFPTLKTQLNLNWDLEPTLSFKKFEVGFRDIAIDLFSLKTLINPIAAKINEILKPIQPVLDSLGEGIPGTNITLIDLLKAASPLDLTNATEAAFQNLNQFLEAYGDLDQLNAIAPTGNYTILNGEVKLNLGNNSPTISRTVLQTATPTNSLSSIVNLAQINGLQTIAPLFNKLGLRLPILSASESFKLLVGQDTAKLLDLDLPVISINNFKVPSAPISLFPGVTIRLGGNVEIQGNLGFGYDAKGLSLTGGENPIAGFNLKQGSKLDLNLELVVGGGLGAENPIASAPLNLRGGLDSNIRTAIAADGTFDRSGKLTLQAIASGTAGLGTTKPIEKTLFDRTVINYDLPAPDGTDWGLATRIGSDVLRLNLGRFASDRNIPGQITDGSETFKVEHVDADDSLSGSETVIVSAFGRTQEFKGIRRIIAEGGAGNDVIELAANVLAESELWGDFAPDVRWSEFTNLGTAIRPRVGTEGNDRLFAGLGQTRLYGQAGNDLLTAENATGLVRTGSSFLYGGEGDDELVGGSSNDFLYGGAGRDDLYGNGGQDLLYGDRTSETLTDLTGLDPNNAGDFLSGGDGEDVLYGELGNDVLEGRNGRDILYGGVGSDSLSGGAGSDYLLGDEGTVNLTTGVVTLGGGVGDDTLFGGSENDFLYGQAGNDRLFGGSGNDYLEGNTGNDILFGDDAQITRPRARSEVIASTNPAIGGSDIIRGQEGDDIIVAGTGNDIQVTGDNGDDIILGDNGRIEVSDGTVIRIETLFPTNGGDDILLGNNGADIILGGTGNDTIANGTDNIADIMLGDNGVIVGADGSTQANDILSKDEESGGKDTITGGKVKNIIIGGSGGSDRAGIPNGGDMLIGNDFDDLIFGDNAYISRNAANEVEKIEVLLPEKGGDDTIIGSSGSDTLYGEGGDDMIIGGSPTAGIVDGTDYLYGGAGNDAIAGDNASIDPVTREVVNLDTVNGAADFIFGDNGTLTFTLGQVTSATSDPASGDGNDTILGNVGNDLIFGGAADDRIFGNLGDDRLLGDHGQVNFDSNGNLTLIRTIAPDAGGNDVIQGNEGADMLLGGFGNDTMTGNLGEDILIGDNGRITLNNSTVILIETTNPENGGNDTINGDENLDVILGGTGNDTILGGDDSANDILLGDNGVVARANGTPQANDIFSTDPTFGGRDTITGGGGQDIIIGGSGGNDTTGMGGDNLTGNDGDDIIVGDSAYITRNANSIIEKIETRFATQGGDDRITGNNGADILLGGFGNDTIAGNQGNDIILGDNGLLDYTLDTNLTTIDLIQSTNPELGGNDTIAGNEGTDIAVGGTANDTIAGGSEDDSLLGDNGLILLTGGAVRLIETIDPGIGGNDTIFGNQGSDLIAGGFANDLIYGDEGDDKILGDNGRFDYAFGGDTIVSSDSNLFTLDFLTTTDPTLGSSDEIYGGSGNDRLLGGTDADALYGDNGVEALDPTWIVAATGDFNGDGKRDVFWRNKADNRTLLWLMDGVNVLRSRLLTPVSWDWSFTQSGDFNGDGKDDLLWRNNSGAIAVWLLDGVTLQDAALIPHNVSMDWNAAIGDLNSDGKDDLFWRHSSGAVSVWLMNGAKLLDFAAIPYNVPTSWTSTLGDLNGDGKQDIFWRHTSGAVSVWLMDGLKLLDFAAIPYDVSMEWTSTLGDLNGDSKQDVFWRHTSGAVSVWLMDGLKLRDFAAIPYNVSMEWTSTLGDLNGDGKQDIFWRHTSGAVSVWLMDGLKLRDFAAIPYNVSIEWTSTIADFDGDGKSDVFWRHSSGMNCVWLFNGLTLKQFDLVTNGAQLLGNDLLLGDHGKVYQALPVDRNYFSIDIGLNLGAGNDTLYGNQGDDILLGQQGNDYLSGGTGEDDMIGGHNVIGGADGNDTMNGDDNADVMLGDNGTITRRPQVGGGWQRYPAPFADVIRDVVRFDDLDRIGGDDVMRGGSGDDIIQGQRGNDSLSGDNGDDEMYGQLGNDWMEGGNGQDFMLGDVGIITREYNPDGTPRINRNGSWHRNALLTDIAKITASLNTISNANFQTSDLFILTSANGGATTQVQAIELFADGNDSMSGGNGDDSMFGQRGNDGMSGDAGNDYMEGNMGDDVMYGGADDDFIVGDNTNNIQPFITEVPTVKQGYHIIEQAAGLNFLLGSYGTILTPNLTLTPRMTYGLVPTLTLSPQVVLDGSAIPIAPLKTQDQTFQSLAAIVPDLSNHLDLVEGNDFINGGAGKDTIVGDNYAGFMPIRTGNSAIDQNLDQLTTALYHLNYDLHDLEVAFSQGQIAKTIAIGNDTIDGEGDRDLIMGDNATFYSPFLIRQPGNADAVNGFVNTLKQSIVSFNSTLNPLLNAFTGSVNSPYTLSSGNDTLNGGDGDDKLLGSDSTIFAPILNTLNYQRGSFWKYGFDRTPKAVRPNFRDFDLVLNNDTMSGGNGNDLMLGGYSNLITPLVTVQTNDQALLRSNLNTLVTDVKAYIRDLFNEQYGINYVNRNQSNTVIAENDVMSGDAGSDLMLGDNATVVLPVVNGSVNLNLNITDSSFDFGISSHNFLHTLPHQFDLAYRSSAKGFTTFGQDTLLGGAGTNVLLGVKYPDRLFGDGSLFGGKEADRFETGSNNTIVVVRNTNPSPKDQENLLPFINANLQDFLSPTLEQSLREVVAAGDRLALEGELYGNPG